MLPTSKMLTVPSPGRIGSTNSFPATMVLSPDGRYAALLNDGYGTQETLAHQSISVLVLKTNQIVEYPDARLSDEAHQSYFIGLAFSSDGKHLYASVGSLTDPTGAKPGNTGNGIAVYRFTEGKVTPERFIPIALQPLSTGKKLAVGLKAPPHLAIPYPAGLAVIADRGHDKLLIANNLSDNAIVLDPATGKVLQRFDLTTSDLVPSSFPYTCVATRDGRRAWCSLWNASQVAELDLTSGKVARWIKLRQPEDPLAPGSHPTAMLLSPDEKILYVALSNVDAVAAVATDAARVFATLDTSLKDQKFAGSYPSALAQSADGKRVFVADASANAVAVLDTSNLMANGPANDTATWPPLGFIPTDWYPSALAVHGDDLLIATAKGEGSRANKDLGKTAYEMKHHDHPYIPTLLKGSIARLNIPSTLEKLPQLTQVVERDNLLHADPGTITFASGQNPIKHVIYVIKENRTFDQILGDLKVGDGDPSLTMYGDRHHAQRAQTRPAVRSARQFLRQRGSFRRRPSLVHRRDHVRLQREDLADRLPRQGAHLRFSGPGRRRISAGAQPARRRRSFHRISLGQSRAQPRQLSRLRRIRECRVVQREAQGGQSEAGNSLRTGSDLSAHRKFSRATRSRPMSAIPTPGPVPGRGPFLYSAE